MRYIFPPDISAEALLNYFPREDREAALLGTHRRNACGDVVSADIAEKGTVNFAFSRDGLYDTLPEALFHPVDRFESLSANEYHERFHEECERQQAEETAARDFFAVFDTYLLELSSVVSALKDKYADNAVLADIIGKNVEPSVRANRFVKRTWAYLPMCCGIRGNMSLLTLMVRDVLFEEGLVAEEAVSPCRWSDSEPRYGCGLNYEGEGDVYLGNEYDEDVTMLRVLYWNRDECAESFLTFVEEMRVYENFVNDFFVSICFRLRFDIVTDALPVRLSDDMCFNYLDYNTNL